MAISVLASHVVRATQSGIGLMIQMCRSVTMNEIGHQNEKLILQLIQSGGAKNILIAIVLRMRPTTPYEIKK
jgi:hypothetical protein